MEGALRKKFSVISSKRKLMHSQRDRWRQHFVSIRSSPTPSQGGDEPRADGYAAYMQSSSSALVTWMPRSLPASSCACNSR
jgi:hypothetical protein